MTCQNDSNQARIARSVDQRRITRGADAEHFAVILPAPRYFGTNNLGSHCQYCWWCPGSTRVAMAGNFAPASTDAIDGTKRIQEQ